MSGPFKMKNQGLASSVKYKTPIQYSSPAKENETKPTDPPEKRTQTLSDEQTDKDIELISKNTNQPEESSTDVVDAEFKETKDDTVKSVKRQNRINTRKMSKKDIKTELKNRKKTGVNKSDKLDVGLLGRVFGSKENLASKLAHQKNVSDI